MLLSIACPDPPFPISSNIVGGGGCLAPRANGTGIVGLEATFEFGRVRTFGFGPLTSAGRITLGLQFRAGKGESAKLGTKLHGARRGQRRALSTRQNSQPASNRSACRRHIVGVARALDDGQQSGGF